MELLPQIEVDFIQELPKELIVDSDSEEESGGANFIYNDEESILPEVKEKNIIPEEDIFVEKVKKVTEPAVKPVKKKRQMSEAQLERLRLGREKALANRRAKAQENKEIKELKVKKKKKEIQQLREEVGEAPVPKPPTRKAISSIEDLPADLLLQLQEKAIEGYDMKRKARKAQKKEEEEQKSIYRHTVQNAINPARPPQYGEAGFFNDCF